MVVKRTAVSTKLSPQNFAFLDKQRRFFRPYDISMSSLVNLCVRIVRQLHVRGELSLEPLQLQAQLSVDLGKFIEAKQRERVTAKIAKHPKHVNFPTSQKQPNDEEEVESAAVCGSRGHGPTKMRDFAASRCGAGKDSCVAGHSFFELARADEKVTIRSGKGEHV
jgi:hypothetical protein